MFRGGYMGNLLRVNLSSRSSSVEEIDSADIRLFLGGRGLGALWYWREIGPQLDPLTQEKTRLFHRSH